MKLQEIKTAVDKGQKVFWSNENYQIVKSENEYLIKSISNNNIVGLTWKDGKTLNGKEDEFFIEKPLITRQQFLDYFRSDRYSEELSSDDCLEVFKTSIKGSSDLTVDLFNEILADYNCDFTVCIDNSPQKNSLDEALMLCTREIFDSLGSGEEKNLNKNYSIYRYLNQEHYTIRERETDDEILCVQTDGSINLVFTEI